MGGTIGKLGGNSAGGGSKPRPVEPKKQVNDNASRRPSQDTQGVADGSRLGDREVRAGRDLKSVPASTAPPPKPDSKHQAQAIRKPGQIAPGVWQLRSPDPKDNVRLLRKHAHELSQDDLRDVVRELGQALEADPASGGSSWIVHLSQALRDCNPPFTPEQLQAMGKGLGQVKDGAWMRHRFNGLDELAAWGCGSYAKRMQHLAAGALSSFRHDPRHAGDLLHQQIVAVLGATSREKPDLAFSLLGALVLQRGVEQIDLEEYERICAVAARNLHITGAETRYDFQNHLPGEHSARSEIADCFARYRDMSISRCNKEPEVFTMPGAKADAKS